jgi:septin family protein
MATTHSQLTPSVFPKSHVGFDSITTQIEKKLLKRGFQFNVICVGMSMTTYPRMDIDQICARIGGASSDKENADNIFL